jgi:hypothetical protein
MTLEYSRRIVWVTAVVAGDFGCTSGLNWGGGSEGAIHFGPVNPK